MPNIRRKNYQSERGGALVELALVLPILAALVVGAAEFTVVERAAMEVSNAAMAGVQYGTQEPNTAADVTGIGTAAQNDAPDITLKPTTATESCICSDGSASTCLPTDCSGSNIETILTVTTSTTVSPPVHLPGLPSSYTLTGQAIQKVKE
jgi:Flp pilus assembly protein TadG